MATSKTDSTAYLPGDDPEALEANRAYQEALRKLTESLDQRKNRFFDPRYLAAAQGFLAPGAPDFFESLGRVAGNVGKAEEAMVKEDQDIAQQKLAVAGQRLEMLRQREADKQMTDYLRGQQPAAGPLSGAAAAAEEGQSQGALSSLDSGESGVYGVQIAPPDPGRMTGRKYIELNRFDRSKSRADLIKEAANIDRQNIEVRESGKFNPITGMFYAFPTGKVEEVQIFGEDNRPAGTYKVDAVTAAQLSHFARTNDPRYWDLARRVIEGPQRRQAPQATPPAATQTAPQAAQPAMAQAMPQPTPTEGPQRPVAATQPAAPAAPVAAPTAAVPTPAKPAAPAAATRPAGLPTVEESEARKAREKALQEANVQMEIEARKDFNQRSRDAGDSITTANMLRRFSEDPNASKMIGILSNQNVTSAIATIVKEGVGSRDFRLAMPAIETVMRNAGLNPEDQAKFRVYLMNIAQMQLQMSKYMKGSVSNFEQELMSRAVASTDDTPQAVRIKADLLTRRAQFDKQANRAFKASKMTAEEFLQSDEYEEMKRKYDDQLGDIAIGLSRYESSSRGAAASSAASPAGGASRAAVPGAGQPSPGFIRDPQTGMIRRKRPGE